MANHKSAKKRLRQNQKLRELHRRQKSAVRTSVKKVIAVAQGSKEGDVQQLFREAEKTIASAITKRLYHKNNGRRKISRLAKLVNNASA